MILTARPATILNVDDNDTGRYVRSRQLRRAGFEVLEASTGAAALDTVSTQKPDLAILDVNLPDISGFEVCRRIKSNPESASIIVLQVSATAVLEKHRVEGLEAGADSYLVEPLPEKVLLATVNSLLRLRQAEEEIRLAGRQWQSTLDSIKIGVCLVDLEGRVLRLNQELARILGLDPGEAAGQASWDLYCRVWPAARESVLSLAVTLKRETWEVPIGDHWFEFAVEPVFTSERSLTGGVHSWTDITERKRAEEARALALEREREAREMAEAANRSKDQFLATLSHELRSPLQSMLGWLYMLRQRSLNPEESRQALETIEQNARAQAQLIDDLLDVSRIISGKLRLEFRPVDLRPVVLAAVESQKPAAVAKGVELVARADVVGAIAGDPGRLQQVVTNLLSNAIKFTPSGGRIEVRLQAEGSCARIQVTDTGVGIAPAILPYIFDRFRQGETASGRHVSGLGLGLAIVRHLVQLHGGTVCADSPGDGQGAIFTVNLPVAAAREVEATEPAPAEQRSEQGPQASFQGLVFLVVDDEPDMRKWMEILLERSGAKVIVAATAREALEHIAERRPDVLVSDLGMPGDDGHALIREVRRLEGGRSSIPAVALSAHAREEDRRQALDSGYQAHLAKPVEAGALLAVLGEIVGQRRNQRSGVRRQTSV